MSAEVAAFAQGLSSAVSIDWKSGEVAFNETSIRAAAESLQRSTAYAVGHAFANNLIANLRSGFVPRLFVTGQVISVGCHWRVGLSADRVSHLLNLSCAVL